jgi:hypothetical protein
MGVNVHSCLAVGFEGLVLDQSSYNRAEPKDESASHESEKMRPIEEEESFRRLETLERSAADIPEGVEVMAVCGREEDMYELFAKAQGLKEPALIRIVQNRMAVEGKGAQDETRKKRWRGRARLPRGGRSGRRRCGRGTPPIR